MVVKDLEIILSLHLLKICEILLRTCSDVGWDSAVGVATRYGRDGPAFEPVGGQAILSTSDSVETVSRTHVASCSRHRDSYRG
jgi:hypothetical protein